MPEAEELLAAKMMGRWRSGAPLALCPMHDDPALGADAGRNNAFLFKQDDPIGYKTPCRLPHSPYESPRCGCRRRRSHSSHDPARDFVWSFITGGRSGR